MIDFETNFKSHRDIVLEILFLAFIGLITGFIDSIVGGGGLISVPSYMLILGPGVSAIATNKVSAFVSTFTAFLIYKNRGLVDFKKYKPFLFSVFIFAIVGAQFSRFMPVSFYKYMMLVLLPLMLSVLFTRNLWQERTYIVRSNAVFVFLGMICGLYDGLAGPGGGTLMFLALFVVGSVPVGLAIGTAKFANVLSSGSSLITYALMGQIYWWVAMPATLTIILGAFFGARLATKSVIFYARWALALVSCLLVLRLIYLMQSVV